MFAVWHGLSSLILMFPGQKIEAPPLSTVQSKCILYTFLKLRTSRFNFRSYVINLVMVNISCFLSKVGSPGADLSAFHATIVESSGLIYWPSVPIKQDLSAYLSAYRGQRVNRYDLLVNRLLLLF